MKMLFRILYLIIAFVAWSPGVCASEVPKEIGQKVEGIWMSEGYDRLLQTEDSKTRIFQVTEVSCSLIAQFPLDRFLPQVDGINVSDRFSGPVVYLCAQDTFSPALRPLVKLPEKKMSFKVELPGLALAQPGQYP